MKKLKEKVVELVAIAKECPENLQQICFDILLRHELLATAHAPADVMPTPSKGPKSEKPKTDPQSAVETAADSQEDLAISDLHVKVRRFLKKSDLSDAHLNQLFYKEGDAILPLYDDLKTTKTSESQIRITILQCLLNAIRTGEFQTTVDAARAEASNRKCFDKNNWGNNFTNNATFFDFTKYSRKVTTIALSEQGKAELANVIKELQ